MLPIFNQIGAEWEGTWGIETCIPFHPFWSLSEKKNSLGASEVRKIHVEIRYTHVTYYILYFNLGIVDIKIYKYTRPQPINHPILSSMNLIRHILLQLGPQRRHALLDAPVNHLGRLIGHPRQRVLHLVDADHGILRLVARERNVFAQTHDRVVESVLVLRCGALQLVVEGLQALVDPAPQAALKLVELVAQLACVFGTELGG